MVVLNIYFVPKTIWHFNHFGGPFYSIIPMLICLIVNGTLFTALYAIFRRKNQSVFLLIAHSFIFALAVWYISIDISIFLEDHRPIGNSID